MKVPERNYRKYWLAYIAHAATGALSGAGVATAIATGNPIYALSYLITLQVQVRQTVEYLRRHDTPGRDLGDNLAGFVAFLSVCAGGILGALTMTTRVVGANPGLKELLDNADAYNYIVLAGGRGSGKDVIAYQYMAYRTETSDRPLSLVVCRAFRETIRHSAQKALRETLIDMGLGDRWHFGADEFRHVNGHSVIFRGTERNIGTIRGLQSIDILFLNEAQYVSEDGFSEIPPTVFRNSGAKIVITMNPRYPNEAVASRFLGPRLEGTNRDDALLLIVNYTDNKFWSDEMESERQNLLRVKGQDWHDHVYLGTYDISAIANPFGRVSIENCRKDVENPGKPAYTAIDIAVTEGNNSDFTVAIKADTKGNLLDFQQFQQDDYKVAVQQLLAFAEGTIVLIDSTGVGHTIAQMILEGNRRAKEIKWTGPLKREMIGSLAGLLDAERLAVPTDKKWDWLEEELLHYERKETTTGTPTQQYGAAATFHDDGVSALMMYAHELWRPRQKTGFRVMG